MVWAQSCKDAIQQRSSNALVIEVRMDHELKFDGVVIHRGFVSEVGSDSKADNIFLFSSNDVFLVTARLLSHVDSNHKRVFLILSLL